MRESELVNAGLQELLLAGIPAWRVNSGAFKAGTRFIRMTSVNGVSDIIGCLPPNGRLLAAEAKVNKNKPSEDQEKFLAAIEKAGGLAVVFYSVEELMDAIEPEKANG